MRRKTFFYVLNVFKVLFQRFSSYGPARQTPKRRCACKRTGSNTCRTFSNAAYQNVGNWRRDTLIWPPLNVMSLSSAQLGGPLGDRQPITGHSHCHLNQSIFFMRAGRTHTPACLSVAPPRRLLCACAVIQRHTLCPSVVNRAVRFIVNADWSTARVSPGPPTTRHVLVLATQRATQANSAWPPSTARRNEYRPPPGKKHVHKTGGDVGYQTSQCLLYSS